MYRWSVGIERNLDQRTGGLLPAGAYDFLDTAQVRRPFALAIPSFECAFARRIGCLIPSFECAFARRIGCLVVASLATTKCSRRLAGSGAMGFASGDGPIGRLGNRAEKHAIGLLLSVVDFLFFEMGHRKKRQHVVGSPFARERAG